MFWPELAHGIDKKSLVLKGFIMIKETQGKTSMNIRLNPHSEQLLKEALSRGEFHSAEEVVERALETLSEGTKRQAAMNAAEFEATLDALAEGSDKLPVLPPDATNRAGIYRDHN
jgi:Arc/MetJ-type ribon-helix-helix transcriptional regulator